VTDVTVETVGKKYPGDNWTIKGTTGSRAVGSRGLVASKLPLSLAEKEATMQTSRTPAETPSEKTASPVPRRRHKVRVAIIESLLLLTAIAGAGLYFVREGHLGRGARTGAHSEGFGASVAGLSAGEKQQAYQSEVSELESRLTRLQSYFDGLPKELVDVERLAQALPTPQAAFEFVRDQVAFEPYPGVMKGARATLITRGGNSLDRALLLAAVLKQNGVSANIAHGKLSLEQAQSLLQQIAASPGSLEQIVHSLAGRVPAVTPTDHQQELGKRLADQGQRAGARVSDAVRKSLPLLQSAVKVGLDLGSTAATRQLDIVQDHYWVQATIGGEETDLDPTFKSATVNSKLAEAEETLDPDALDEELFQHLHLRLVGEFLDDGSLQSRDLLSKDARVADLFGKNLRLAIAPFSPKTDEERFQALLLIGDERTEGEEFRLGGQATETGEQPSDGGGDNGAGKATGGMLGGLAGQEDEAAAPKPKSKPPSEASVGPALARLYLEVTSAGPHLGEARYRRVILDRLESSKAQILPALGDDNVVRSLLVQAWDGTISVGANSPVYVLGTQLDHYKAQESMEEKARARAYLGQDFGVSDLPGPAMPPELTNYFFASDVARFLLSRRDAPKAQSYYERPRLAFIRHGFVVGDWTKPEGVHRFAQGIDLINAPFQFVGDPADAVRLEAGIADTALERLTVTPNSSFNTIPLFEAASAQSVSVLTISPQQNGTLDNLAVPPAIKNVLAGELAQGQTLVLPARLVRLGEVQTYGWWSVDPASGVALGKMELGGAQAMTETAEMHERIEKWTEIFAKFYGGLLQCYMGALGDNLGGLEALQTGHLKHGEPGESPMPNTDALAECVISTACDTVAELLTEAALSPIFAKEAEAEIRPIREIIEDWAMETAATKTAEWSVGKACEQGVAGGE